MPSIVNPTISTTPPMGPILDIDMSKLPIPKDLERDTGLQDELAINEVFSGLVRGQATAVLIDVNNLYRRSMAEGFSLEYTKIKDIIAARCDLRYFAVVTAIDVGNPAMHPWIDSLRQAGITCITKPVRPYYDEFSNESVYKGNMDVELTIDAMSLSDGFAHVIIGSCDGDFIPLIKRLREGRFRTVSVMGVSNHLRKGMSQDLIKCADNFYDLRLIAKHVSPSVDR